MRHTVVFLGILLPAAFSHALYGALRDDDRERRLHVRRHAFEAHSELGRPGSPRLRPAHRRHGPSGECPVSEVQPLSAPAGPEGRIAVRIGAGEIDMEAVPGLDRVEVEARLCGPSRAALERMGAVLGADADGLSLGTVEPRGSGGRVDLRVRVPLGMAATITDDR